MFSQSSYKWAQSTKKSVQSPKMFSQSSYKWVESAKGVQGERSGISIDNVR
jgi:hypothetical protein